jgi:hypothetical protein
MAEEVALHTIDTGAYRHAEIIDRLDPFGSVWIGVQKGPC